MTLKEKAEHYRKTQEYLAQNEEDDFVKDNIIDWLNQWSSFDLNSKEFYNEDLYNYISCNISIWQFDNGFYLTNDQVKRKYQ